MKLSIVFTLLALLGQSPALAAEGWYRGNTHAHTELCGHADSAPEVVARWYLDHGYNFLILSEHNLFIDPAKVSLPTPRRDDFILIPGEEVTGKQHIHLTAMNIHQLVPWDFDDPSKARIIQQHVDHIHAAGGQPVLNHPNWEYTLGAEDIDPIHDLPLFELFNGHPHVHNEGDHEHASTEAIWDTLLSRGKLIYAVSSDDAHSFKAFGAEESNPGRGWVMVHASALTPDAITEAMRLGHFYASNGVFLKNYYASAQAYRVEVDSERTLAELAQPELRGRLVPAGREGVSIDFIGQGGKLLRSVQGLKAEFGLRGLGSRYIRARVTWIRRHPQRGLEAFYAWGQPVFKLK
ncbi:MAG: CehA/McbA family metallohydrolase [Candidatus Sericytochromatia bacterium]